MKLFKIFIIPLIILQFTLGACTVGQQQFAMDSARVFAELEILKKYYANTTLLIESNRHSFSDEEWGELMTVDATIQILIEKLNAITTFQTYDVSISEIEYMWNLSKESYVRARRIVGSHWDSFSPGDRVLLSSLDTRAKITNEQITKMLANPDKNGIDTSLIMITTLSAMALKLFLPII